MGVRVLVMVWSDLSSLATGQVGYDALILHYNGGTENHADCDYMMKIVIFATTTKKVLMT